jgi:plastocyanin
MKIPETRRSVALYGTVAITLIVALSGCDDGGSGGVPADVTSGADGLETSAPATIPVTNAAPGPATFRIIAGKAEGNRDVEAFMPADVRIRAGDTLSWLAHGFEGHTVTFGDSHDDVLAGIGPYLIPDPDDPEQVMFTPTLSLPSERQGTHDGDGAFINSGFIGIPVETTYELTFTEEGRYSYLCLVHPFTMTGTVSVEAPDAQVESPETVAARGEADLAKFLEELEAEARRLADDARTAPTTEGGTIHYVQVGAITDHGQVAVYTPGSIDIAPGDAVIFQNDDRNFHNVIFKGDGEVPPGIGIKPGPEGLNFTLAKESALPVDPPPEGFDETTFLSSGSMGITQPRLTWTLRFDTPGKYVYECTIHFLAGMTGVINVE